MNDSSSRSRLATNLWDGLFDSVEIVLSAARTVSGLSFSRPSLSISAMLSARINCRSIGVAACEAEF